MDLKEVVITSIANVTTVYSPKGRAVEMRDRLCYGLSLCIDGQITYVQDGKEYVSDRDHVVILPQGQNYSVRGDKTGRFPVIEHTLDIILKLSNFIFQPQAFLRQP